MEKLRESRIIKIIWIAIGIFVIGFIILHLIAWILLLLFISASAPQSFQSFHGEWHHSGDDFELTLFIRRDGEHGGIYSRNGELFDVRVRFGSSADPDVVYMLPPGDDLLFVDIILPSEYDYVDDDGIACRRKTKQGL